MIFVAVGTSDFDPLIRTMDDLAPSLGEPVVMQVGRGTWHPVYAARWFPFAPSLEPYYRAASVVVSHGGLGTLVEVLRARKRLVGVSNPERYDRHQEDLLSAFEQAGYLVWCRDLRRMGEAIAAARTRTFRIYRNPPCTLHHEIARLLAPQLERAKDGDRHSVLEPRGRFVWRMPENSRLNEPQAGTAGTPGSSPATASKSIDR
jgi:UDP-N-acetylglucosamine transferase subunit ALG13